MKKIYLVQKMERDSFKKWARKGIKVESLQCYGQVMTMWSQSKRKAINSCREKNREQNFEVFFVNLISAF